MENTKIQWAHHTFNCWRGCEKVSPGCDNCYAEAMSHRNPRALGEWGPEGKRVIAAESYWRQPLAWDRRAREAGERHRVFCLSLGDVWEYRPDLEAPRARLLRLIHQTPHLDWLLLTKRPQNIAACLTAIETRIGGDAGDLAAQWRYGSPMPNVWLGVSVEDQQRADERITVLLTIPAAVRFLSCEPLLGEVNLERWLVKGWCPSCGLPCFVMHGGCGGCGDTRARHLLNWVIVGGESGSGSRPFGLAWARSLRDQCKAAGAAYFMKQMGQRPFDPLEADRHGEAHPEGPAADPSCRLQLIDRKGGDPEEWPEDLCVREVPLVPQA